MSRIQALSKIARLRLVLAPQLNSISKKSFHHLDQEPLLERWYSFCTHQWAGGTLWYACQRADAIFWIIPLSPSAPDALQDPGYWEASLLSLCNLLWLILNVASLRFYLWALCSVSQMFKWFPEWKLHRFLPLFFSFLACSILGNIYFYWLWIVCCLFLVMGRTCVCRGCVIRVLCGWGRMLPIVVASLQSCWSQRALPGHVAFCLVPLTALLCDWAAVFPTSPLLMGIWAISSPLLLLVLQWIIMYIYHSMFLTNMIPLGVDFYERDWWVKK